MKPHRLLALLALALVLVAGGTAPGASSDTCRDTDVVFYTTDTMRLATELSKSGSACADYYLSVTPTTPGGPRPGPLPTLRSLGPRFHGMPEVRFENWAGYAGTNGWFAAGVEFRRQMRTVGYDVSLGDTWAINEIGAPSVKGMGVAVFRNIGSARRDFLDFVRGLYTGDDGIPSPGLVFVADPLQVTGDLAQYEQELAAWYADAAFWEELGQYVRFWAQETYADATAWGVPGSTLADRSAYLNDYFLHGIRLAQRNDGSTAAARAFLANAYTPVGNASYRWPAPDTTSGIGYGKTDIGLPGMLSFVSAQTHALRSSTGDRFGFAVVPQSAAPAETIAVESRIGAAIKASESDPGGACGSSGFSCDAAVAGATFNDAWKVFANTLEGSQVAVQLSPDVAVAFPSVTARGSTWVESAPLSAPAPARFRALPGTLEQQLATTARYGGPIEVCVDYDPGAYEGYTPRLFEPAGHGWNDVTTSIGVSAVCGRVAALGTVAVFAGDPTPPAIVPTVEGQLGENGWYTGDVTVTWSVVDPQSSVVTSGCATTKITADTAGTTLTCIATSDGGTSSASVTVRRDATPPVVTCTPTPSRLWPPNGKLVPVAVDVIVTDATSGPGAFRLAAAGADHGDPEDIVGFELGTADVAGTLRAERSGTEAERAYALSYRAHDLAGNAAGCVATVVVPHDERS